MRKLTVALLGLALASCGYGQTINHARRMSDAASKMNGGLVLPVGYLTIKDETTSLTQRGILTFLGAGVSCADNAGNTATECTISGSAGFPDAAANSKLIGSGSAGAGSPYGPITLGAGLTMTGTTLSSSGSGMADPGGNGMMARTALNTSINRTLACGNTACVMANGDGVAGAPTVTVTANTTDPGGAIVGQASAPGTVQTANNFFNISGLGTVTKDDIKTTDTDAMFLSNTTASDAVNTVQKSPALKFCGHAWNSTGSVDNLDCFRVDLLPVTVAGTTTSTLQFRSSINGGAYSTTSRFSISSGGTLSAAGSATVAQNITATAGNVTAQAGDVIIGTNTNRILWGSGGNVGGIANVGGVDGDFRTELAAGTASASRMTSGNFRVIGGNSQSTNEGWLAETTGSLAGLTTYTSTIQLPANSIIEAVTYRVTTSITTATSYTIGDTAGNVGRFCGTQTNVTATNTGVCLAHRQPDVTAAMGPVQTTADTIKITFNGAVGAGVMRISIHYKTFVAPTS